VRRGLVVIGLTFAVVGAGMFTSFYLFSSTEPAETLTSSVSASFLAPNQTEVWTLSAVVTGAGVLALSWTSTAPANVSFWKATPCTAASGLCPVEPAIVTWASNLTGHWKGSGSVGSSYLLGVTGKVPADLDFYAAFTESYPGPAFDPGAPGLVLLTIGSVLLLGTGAVGVFLGLFLPGGVYRPPDEEPDFSPVYRNPGEDRGEEPPDDDSPTLP
jgi:hypothetical protein